MQDNPFAEALKRQQQNQPKPEENKKEKVITVNDKKYRIKRWTNTEAMRKLPTVANLLFVPVAAPIAEATDLGENGDPEMIPELFSAADMMVVLFQRFQEVNLEAFFVDLLDETYIYGKNTPVDFDEDFDSVLEIIPVVVEVLQANFMMQLCRDLFGMTTQSLWIQEINLAMTSSTHTSKEQ